MLSKNEGSKEPITYKLWNDNKTYYIISCPVRKCCESQSRLGGVLTTKEAQVETLQFLVQPKKDNNQFKNKRQPELPENQTAWISHNQGIKETFIQTGRRGRDGEPWQRGQQRDTSGMGTPTFTCDG